MLLIIASLLLTTLTPFIPAVNQAGPYEYSYVRLLVVHSMLY